MKKDGIIKGIMVTKEELKELGSEDKYFSYYVDAIITLKDKTVVLNKCKAIESDEGETVYFTEGDNTVLIFYASKNPNMKIKKSLLN